MNIFKRARTRYILYHHAISHQLWFDVSENLPCLHKMAAVEKAHLRELTTLFLHDKNFVGVQGLQMTNDMCVTIAVQACLPVLGLGIAGLAGWTDIVVYPAAFQVSRDDMDSIGVVHHQDRVLVGESWSHGPIILSWEEVAHDAYAVGNARNVVIHEIAHKLDMLNGSANGFPPLHYGMDITLWTTTLSDAYQTLVHRIEHRHRSCINPYAASNPGEFFAVCSEYFFCAPDILNAHFAKVYQQLQQYYRQDPLLRSTRNLSLFKHT